MAQVLLVDDEPAMLYALRSLVEGRGDTALLADSGARALELLDGDVDLVVTDFAMPGMNGLELLDVVRGRDPNVPVVLLTAHGSERIAVRAIRGGAYDYITKPFDVDELSSVLDRALELRALRLENLRLSGARTCGLVVGESPAMRRLLDVVGRVAPKDVTVLVRGETGTGKELIAALLHAQSRRSKGPLVRFNCAAIPGELAEAELFGHARGAFTGATQARRGYFERADGGTLVLDEVGELPLPIQAKVLRALQEGELQPVGAGQVHRVDVRVVACTNRDLAAEAEAGRFRQDLYYRLAVVELVVPPLREHVEDIAPLVTEFARRYAERFGIEPVRIAPELLDLLTRADWPGNVRQLENCIARMLALGTGGELGPSAFTGVAQAGDAGRAPDDTAAEAPTLREQVEALERNVLARTLAATNGNQSEAARRLGLSRSALIDRLNKYAPLMGRVAGD